MAAAPSRTGADCTAAWGWTMILHWLGTQRWWTLDTNLSLLHRSSAEKAAVMSPAHWHRH